MSASSSFIADPIAPDSSPALGAPSEPHPRAGEILLTQGQKLALLVMRQSDLSKAILAGVVAKTHAGPSGRDFYTCARLGLAINKGRFHILTPQGRWRSDRIAIDVARQFGLHIISYDYGSPGRPAYAKCTCGWRVFRTRAIHNYSFALATAADDHLRFVGAEK